MEAKKMKAEKTKYRRLIKLSPFILSLFTSVVVLLMLPYSIVAIATGYTFYYAYKEIVTVLGIGTAVIFFGCYLGALISFPIGRRICRVRVKAYA